MRMHVSAFALVCLSSGVVHRQNGLALQSVPNQQRLFTEQGGGETKQYRSHDGRSRTGKHVQTQTHTDAIPHHHVTSDVSANESLDRLGGHEMHVCVCVCCHTGTHAHAYGSDKVATVNYKRDKHARRVPLLPRCCSHR